MSKAADLVRALACLLLALPLAFACKPKATSKQKEAPAVEVAFAGCVELASDVCVLDEQRALRIWLQGDVQAIELKTNAGAANFASSRAHGGTLLNIHVPEAASWLELSSKSARLNHINLRSSNEPQEISSARTLAKTDLHAAQRRLEGLLPKSDQELAARISSVLGRIHMQAGRYDDAQNSLEASANAFTALGLRLSASKDRLAMSFIASTRRNDASLALRLLSQAGNVDPRARELRAEIDYQHGLAESMVGNVRGALGFVKQALIWAQRLQISTLEVAAQQWLAMTLSSVGRVHEALAIQSQLVSLAPANPCVASPLVATLAWLSSLQKPLDVAQTKQRLAQARQAAQACPDPFRDRNQTLNEITFLLATEDYSGAALALRRLQRNTEGRTGDLAVLELELEGRLALAGHDPRRAVNVFQRAETLATASGLADEALRMRVWRAQALAEQGQTREAISLLEQAERTLDQRLQLVPVGEGRVRFVQMRDQGVRTLMNLHLRAGDVRKAFDVARRGRSRALRALALGEQLASLQGEARAKWLLDIAEYQRLRTNAEQTTETWSLSQAELTAQAELRREHNERAQAALDAAYQHLVGNLSDQEAARPLSFAEDEVALLFLKEPDIKRVNPMWRGFAASAKGVTTALLGAPNGDQTDHPWLVPFGSAIEHASRLTILFTDVATEEIHSATFKQKSLQSRAVVTYSLDIAPAVAASGPALVAADPTDDLPGSHQEGQEVANWLGAPATAKLLLGSDNTRAALMALLPESGWFHYAGHSVFEGEEGLESGLPLAGQQRLLAADVLSLPSVPKVVVLSACEAGRSSGDSNTAGLGLAQAFVVAGAKVVIAPTKPVSDVISREFMQRFYKQVSSGLPPERALQTTMSEANAQQQNDWSTFRALVP